MSDRLAITMVRHDADRDKIMSVLGEVAQHYPGGLERISAELEQNRVPIVLLREKVIPHLASERLWAAGLHTRIAYPEVPEGSLVQVLRRYPKDMAVGDVVAVLEAGIETSSAHYRQIMDGVTRAAFKPKTEADSDRQRISASEAAQALADIVSSQIAAYGSKRDDDPKERVPA